MGRGDKRTKRGKISSSSYGKFRKTEQNKRQEKKKNAAE